MLIGGMIQSLFYFHGHMSVVDYSAFDPIFYLHHCNIDRLLAIWQYIHPDSYIENLNRPGADTNPEDPLPPFFREQDPPTHWSSADCRDTRAFNYFYEECDSASSREELQANMISAYEGKNSFMAKVRAIHNHDEQKKKLEDFREWFVLIDIEKSAFKGSFAIHVFLEKDENNISEDPNDWMTMTGYCGFFSIFSREEDTECSECLDQPDIVVGGMVELTETMISQPMPMILTIPETGDSWTFPAYIDVKQKLAFRVCHPHTGEIIDAKDIPSFRARVVTVRDKMKEIRSVGLDENISSVYLPVRYDWVEFEVNLGRVV